MCYMHTDIGMDELFHLLKFGNPPPVAKWKADNKATTKSLMRAAREQIRKDRIKAHTPQIVTEAISKANSKDAARAALIAGSSITIVPHSDCQPRQAGEVGVYANTH